MLMCNNCGNSGCMQCYQSVPSQWPCTPSLPCAPVYQPGCRPTGLNLLYAGLATINLEFFNMPVVPKTIIAAPGPGKLIVPLQVWNFLKFGTTPYADITPATPNLIMSIGSTNIQSDSAILGALADQTTYYTQPLLTISGTLANQPLTISTITQPVVGDSVLYSYIIYTIVNL